MQTAAVYIRYIFRKTEGDHISMRKQLQGISLILFGIMLILFSMVNPWLPIVGGIPAFLAFWVGLASGIVGLVFSFRNT